MKFPYTCKEVELLKCAHCGHRQNSSDLGDCEECSHDALVLVKRFTLNEEQIEALEQLANAYEGINEAWSDEWDGNEEIGRLLPHMDVYEAALGLYDVVKDRKDVMEGHSFYCRSCKMNKEVMLKPSDVAKWRNGALAQVAFPYLKPAERELLISNTCGDCWTKLFGSKKE